MNGNLSSSAYGGTKASSDRSTHAPRFQLRSTTYIWVRTRFAQEGLVRQTISQSGNQAIRQSAGRNGRHPIPGESHYEDLVEAADGLRAMHLSR